MPFTDFPKKEKIIFPKFDFNTMFDHIHVARIQA